MKAIDIACTTLILTFVVLTIIWATRPDEP